MKIHVQFLIVFSSARSIDLRVCSFGYCFRNIRHHNRCFGSELGGASNFIFSQTIEHTFGVTPKNALKFLLRVAALSFGFFFVYLLPSFKNVLEVVMPGSNRTSKIISKLLFVKM